MRWLCLIALAGCSSSTTLVDGGGGGREVMVEGCRAADIAEAIRGASPGDVVRFGDCELTGGSLGVPPGVVLAGSGPETSTLEIDMPIEVEAASGGCTGVRDLKIISDADFAIRTMGPGEVCIESVEIESTRGTGIVAEGTTRLTVRDSAIAGPVTELNADTQPFDSDDPAAAAHGLVASCVERVQLENVEVRGWGNFGVLVVNGRLTWRGGRIVETLGTGLLVYRSEAELVDLEIADIYQGTRLIPSYGIVTNESVMTTSMLWVHESQGYGALHNGGRTHHADARFEQNRNSGAWVQSGDLSVEDGVFDGNGAAGIAGFGAGGLRIERTLLARSTRLTRIVATMPVDLGDGLIVDGVSGPLTLRDVRIEDNSRAGALIELPPDFAETFEVEGVTVGPATFDGLPAFIVVGGPPSESWIGGVSPREAATRVTEPPIPGLGFGVSGSDLPAFNPSCE